MYICTLIFGAILHCLLNEICNLTDGQVALIANGAHKDRVTWIIHLRMIGNSVAAFNSRAPV